MSKRLIILALALSLLSCAKAPESKVAPVLSVPQIQLSAAAAQQFIKVEASGSWSLNFNFGTASAWADLSKSKGTGSESGIVLSWDENADTQTRECKLTLVSEGQKDEVTLTQDAAASSTPNPVGPTELSPDTPGKWLELPATDQKGMYFFTHDMTRGGKKVRNYSFYYDPQEKMSAWVAYPLNSGLIGSGSRSNEWGLDPKVPAKYQQILYRGYSGSYQRGHQIPSADRYGPGINEQTFYFINSTPQKGELNEKAWAKLEGYVRNWSKQVDTLYVVTGADFREAIDVAYDNEGNTVNVPSGYYKALLAYKSGGSIGNTTGGYIGIAFYFDHKYYSDSAIMDTQLMSIDALESKLGMDFFVNLPAKLGEDVASKIESSSDKTWWNNNK